MKWSLIRDLHQFVIFNFCDKVKTQRSKTPRRKSTFQHSVTNNSEFIFHNLLLKFYTFGAGGLKVSKTTSSIELFDMHVLIA